MIGGCVNLMDKPVRFVSLAGLLIFKGRVVMEQDLKVIERMGIVIDGLSIVMEQEVFMMEQELKVTE